MNTEVPVGDVLPEKKPLESVGVPIIPGVAEENVPPLTQKELDNVPLSKKGPADIEVKDIPTGETPEEAKEIAKRVVEPVKPPPTVLPDGKKIETPRELVESINKAEKYSGESRPWEEGNKPKKNRWLLWGLLPLNTRNWRESYNFYRDIKGLAGFGVLIWALRFGWFKSRESGLEKYQVNDQTTQLTFLLDRQRNESGKRIFEIVKNTSTGKNLDEKSTWPKDSNLWQTARGMENFWETVSNPNLRDGLIKKLPDGVAKDALRGLPNRQLNDDEIKTFLENQGVDPANAYLMEQVVTEFRNGTGNVSQALEKAQKK